MHVKHDKTLGEYKHIYGCYRETFPGRILRHKILFRRQGLSPKNRKLMDSFHDLHHALWVPGT